MTWVEVPIPPSANHLWRTVRGRRRVRVILSASYRKWLDVAVPLLRIQMDQVKEYPVAILVEIKGGKGWRKNRDCSNAIKAVEDAVKHAGRIVDDNTDYVQGVLAYYVPPDRVGSLARCRVKWVPRKDLI
jgi:Holliday junction resolvase RusA-like endonuclease